MDAKKEDTDVKTAPEAPAMHTGEQEPGGPGRRTRNTTLRWGIPMNRSQVVKETTHAAQRTKRAHRQTRAKWPRTPHTQYNTPSKRTRKQEPRGPRHRTRNTTHRAYALVNRSQVAQDNAHATQRTKRAGR